jgi:hypothetical protein
MAWAQTYRWTDAEGGVHYSQGLYGVPERFRSKAQLLVFPERPAASSPNPSSPEGAASQVTRIPFTPGKPIMVSAKINGRAVVQLMLDTGADGTVIKPAAMFGLWVSYSDAPTITIRGATGTSSAPLVSLESLEVGGARVGPIRVLAHDVELAQGDGLLGRDFLDQFEVNIDSMAGVVTISPK